MDAGHPNYDDAQTIDGFKDSGGGLFAEYPSVTADSLLGVPLFVVDAAVRESTINPGNEYAIVAAIMTKRKMLTPKEEGDDPYQGEIGYKVSFSTGAFRVTNIVKQMVDRGFASPYCVMLSKVEGGHIRARTLVQVEESERAAAVARLKEAGAA